MDFIKRDIESPLRKALLDAPVLYLNGPRQAGKNTLCRSLGDDFHYVTFDRVATQASAQADPIAFVNSLPPKTIIDEVQLVPEIFRAIKYLIDELRLTSNRSVAGHFLLTGSANIMALPNLAESLVGRMQALTLLPFSAAEALDGTINFIPSLFEKAPLFQKVSSGPTLYQIIQNASFPEVSLRNLTDPVAWYENYLSNIINRDIKALADIDKITQLPRMFTLLANRAGNLLNHASFSRDVGLAVSTYKRYLTLLEHVFLVILVEPWFKNTTKRLVKSPKIYITDTALLLASLGQTSIDDSSIKGAILENFVASELTKHICCLKGYKLFYFRTSDGKEVDFVVERNDGAIIAVEVKYASTVTSSDFKGLKSLQKETGPDFIRGIVLYQGDEVLPFGDVFFAMPLSCLWTKS